MSISTTDEFVTALGQSRLLEPSQLEELTSTLAPRFSDPRELAKHLMQSKWLTAFQINQIYQGNAADLILGQYRLLERIGEGGMGQVYKARHARMDRVVALKVMRKERLENPEAVKRFRREVQAAGQLAHPNIVMAFDADEVGQTHFFAMEYVDGIDVARLVREHGPLPIDLACECVRQAALGLQHALECDLVHRDIKPANVLIARPSVPRGSAAAPPTPDEPFTWDSLRGGTTKILDMGLARLRHGPGGNAISQLTQEGTVMGTPDFIAPEQAMNSSTADIRADLYSLGCTFYYMLTGEVPFPGGTMMEKVLKHRVDQPTPVERLRPDVPRGVLEVVRRMLAKKPEERFQKPADVAAALAPYCGPADAGKAASVGPPGRTGTIDSDAEQVISDMALDQTGSSAARRIVEDFGRPRSRWPTMVIVVLAVVAIGVGVATWIHRPTPPPPPPVAPLDRLDASTIPAELRDGLPPSVVAMLGRPDGRHKALALAFSRDGRRLAYAGDDATVHLVDLDGPREVLLKPALANHVVSVAFSADSRTLAAASLGGEVRAWDLRPAKPEPKLMQAASDKPTYQVAITDHGETLAAAGDDRLLKLWNLVPEFASSPFKEQPLAHPLRWMAFSDDGKVLVTVYQGEKSIRLWSRPEVKQLKSAGQIDPNVGPISVLAFSQDGKHVASSGEGKTIVLSGLEGTRVLPKKALPVKHAAQVSALAFSPDGRRFVSTDDEGRILVWDVALRDVVFETTLADQRIRAAAFAPDNVHFATANSNGTVTIFRFR